MSDHSSYSASHSASLSRSREFHPTYRHPIQDYPGRRPSPRGAAELAKQNAKRHNLNPNWANLPAPLPPSPPPTIFPHPSSLADRREYPSQQPVTPPHRIPHHRVVSAPMAARQPRAEYSQGSSSHRTLNIRSRSRPSSDGYDNISRLSRRSPRSSPKTRGFPWPPPGFSPHDMMLRTEARNLIGHGALEYHGSAVELPFTDDAAHRFFAVVSIGPGNRVRASDSPTFPDRSLRDMSLSFMGADEGEEPWGSLEYPNMLYSIGRIPGTTTITYFVGMRGRLRTPLDWNDGLGRRKRMKLVSILERLNDLERGLGESPEDQYDYLYNHLIEDPERHHSPHRHTHLQMIDLMNVLMNKEWIDFSIPKNQVVAKFFDSPDDKVKTKFFHQLLLAEELYLRIQSPDHMDDAKRKLLKKLPPKVLWDLALAQRWLENMSIEQEAVTNLDKDFHFQLNGKKRQKGALKHFARLLKWPNMEELESVLEERGNSLPIEERSADTMSWFTGVVLPGPTLPFLLMNSLIDCDEGTNDRLAYLTHVRPNCGFQYRANTYWSYKCILGKVLGAARGVRAVGGWVGPCHYTPDLDRTQCALIRTRPQPSGTRRGLDRDTIEDMVDRTSVLGTAGRLDGYCLSDFEVPELPDPADADEQVVRIQKLAFRPVSVDDTASPRTKALRGAKLYDAAVMFAFAGCTLPIRLRHDVEFIGVPQCRDGPHPLWRGFRTEMIRADEGLREHVPGGRDRRSSSLVVRERRSGWSDEDELFEDPTARILSLPSPTEARFEDGEEPQADTVLVIDATGYSDNEVFARAWCAYWGEHAIVANLWETCVACAVRGAVATGVKAVICTEGGKDEERDKGVWDLLSQVD